MLGAEENPHLGPADRMLKESAEAEKLGDSFKKTTVGVYFGNPGETVSDHYFGLQGADRTGCKLCGGCMVVCRHGALSCHVEPQHTRAISLGVVTACVVLAEPWLAHDIVPHHRASRLPLIQPLKTFPSS